MTRQALVRVLLSLLLLISQQMASSHVMSHLTGSLGNANATANATAAQVQQAGDASLSDAFAQDPTCHQCLAFAQMASAVGSKAHLFDLPNPGSFRIAARAVHDSGARTILAFQSRGPPQA